MFLQVQSALGDLVTTDVITITETVPDKVNDLFIQLLKITKNKDHPS